MATYGSNTTSVFANNCTITAGGDVFALGVGVRVNDVGNDVFRQSVIGVDKTMIGVGSYTGTIEIDTLFCTDGDFMTLTTPSGTTGQLPETTITLTLKDTTSTPVTNTLTIKAYLNKVSYELRENAFVRHGVRGEITNQSSRVALS